MINMKPDWGGGGVEGVLRKKGGGSEFVSVHWCPGRKSLDLVDKTVPFKREGYLIRALHGKNIPYIIY